MNRILSFCWLVGYIFSPISIWDVYIAGVILIPIVIILLQRCGVKVLENDEDAIPRLLGASILWPIIAAILIITAPIKILEFIAFGRRNHE